MDDWFGIEIVKNAHIFQTVGIRKYTYIMLSKMPNEILRNFYISVPSKLNNFLRSSRMSYCIKCVFWKLDILISKSVWNYFTVDWLESNNIDKINKLRMTWDLLY